MRTKTRVSAIIITRDQILLIHRRKNGKEYWVFPGGGVEEGETNEKAMVREIQEETGLKTIAVKWAFDDPKFWYGGDNVFYYVEVEYDKPQLGGPEKEKLSETDWYQPEWVKLSKINDLEIYPERGKKVLIK